MHRLIRISSVCWLLAAMVCSTPAARAAEATTRELVWHNDLDQALSIAASSYQSTLVLFSADGCPWCYRLKTHILPDPELSSLLQRFTLVEVNVTEQPDVGRYYQISGVPVVMVMSSNGQILARQNGASSVSDMQRLLRGLLNLQAGDDISPEIEALISQLAEGEMADDAWPALLSGVGGASRDSVRQAVFSMKQIPRATLVQHLRHPRLSVRLGAMELLEELAGTNHGFDPWLDAEKAIQNESALKSWQAWAGEESSETVTQVFTGLSEDRLQSNLADLLSDERERSLRAMRVLQNSDGGTDEFLSNYLQEHPDLSMEHRGRLNEVRYSLRLPVIDGVAPEQLAHRLVFGNLDQRLAVIDVLDRAGKGALSILVEQLEDSNALIRERAIEQFIAIGGKKAVPTVVEHLKTERDTEVHYAAIQKLGHVSGKAAYQAIQSYLTHEKEDLVIGALTSLQRQETRRKIDGLPELLRDPRWRVRVAALETVGKLRQTYVRDEVLALLRDEEAFVRFTAANTIATIPNPSVYKTLAEIYQEDPDLRLTILQVYAALDHTPSQEILDSLDQMPADQLQQAVASLAEIDAIAQDLAKRYQDHASPDVQVIAIRIMMGRGRLSDDAKRLIADKLMNAEQPVKIGILEAIQGFEPMGSGEAFDQEKKIIEELVADDEGGAVADLFAAFDADEPEAKPDAAPTETPDIQLRKALLAQFAGDDMELKTQAAVAMLLLGGDEPPPPEVDKYLGNALSASSAGKRREILTRLRSMPDKAAFVRLAKPYIIDPDESVRSALLWPMSRQPEGREAIIQALLMPDTPLKPSDATNLLRYQIEPGVEADRKLLAPIMARDETRFQIMSLFLLSKIWRSDDLPRAEAALESTNVYLRRAGAHALVLADPVAFAERAKTIAADPSPDVRVVLPSAYAARIDIAFMFDATEAFSDSDWQRNPRPMDDDTAAVITDLLDDPDPRVRFESGLSLLLQGKPVDLQVFEETLQSFSDVTAPGQRVATFLQENYARLGPEFKLLLPYLQYLPSHYDTKPVYAHFKVSADDAEALDLGFAVRRESESYIATFTDAPEVTETAADARIDLVYFAQAGCDHCEQVQSMLTELQAEIPSVVIEQHDIRKNAGRLLNETLCQHFDVPEVDRMIAPSVFGGGGYLITEDIEYGELRALAERSRGVPREQWYLQTDDEMQASESRIEARFSNLTMALVIGNGFMDGINPCAFATIIFFLSYLRLARRSRREIAQVSVAFILGVFLTYLVLGLGLMEVVARIQALRVAGAIMNWTVVGMAGVLAVMSVYDGVLCLQGRAQESTLQLPSALKERIRGAIRHGTRHKRFVIAAFTVGCAISVLELACTGQVYVPTILYMIENGADTIGPYGYLVTYNLAFVLPLIVIFLLAYFGMGSEAISAFFQRHVAAIKFGMAGVFIMLVVMFLVTR